MKFEHRPLIVLMTDFGLADTFVGQMKGVILSIAPTAQIIDLTHAVAPQNIAQGAFLLDKSVQFFPERTIFIAVVDPGVGTPRKAIAIRTANHTFLAPDNGLLTPLLLSGNITGCVQLTNKRYMLPELSSTFHGRDIFSPAAAHLASGVSLHELGESREPSECITMTMPDCRSSDHGKSWEGSIIYTDHFGNLVTSLEARLLDSSIQWHISAGNCSNLPITKTYEEVAEQQPLAYAGSSGTIEIAIRNGNAAKVLGLRDGDIVRATSSTRLAF